MDTPATTAAYAKETQNGLPPAEELVDGIEPEQEDVEERITEPFDPEQIRIRTVPFLVQQLVSRIDHNDIELQPDFQRLQGIWSIRNRSRLVESLVLKIPLPVFYVYADANEHWSVVDGVQRMSTIYDFVKDKLELRGLEYMLSLNGKKHVDLPLSVPAKDQRDADCGECDRARHAQAGDGKCIPPNQHWWCAFERARDPARGVSGTREEIPQRSVDIVMSSKKLPITP